MAAIAGLPSQIRLNKRRRVSPSLLALTGTDVASFPADRMASTTIHTDLVGDEPTAITEARSPPCSRSWRRHSHLVTVRDPHSCRKVRKPIKTLVAYFLPDLGGR